MSQGMMPESGKRKRAEAEAAVLYKRAREDLVSPPTISIGAAGEAFQIVRGAELFCEDKVAMRLWGKRQLCDMLVSADGGKVFEPVHSLVMLRRFPVFEPALIAVEQGSELYQNDALCCWLDTVTKKSKVILFNTSNAQLQTIIAFAYCARVIVKAEDLLGVWQTARRLGDTDMSGACERAATACVCADNVAHLSCWAQEMRSQMLEYAVKETIDSVFGHLTDEQIQLFPFDYIVFCAENKHLEASETDVLEKLHVWQTGATGAAASSSSLSTLAQMIDFTMVDRHKLQNWMMNSPILREAVPRELAKKAIADDVEGPLPEMVAKFRAHKFKSSFRIRIIGGVGKRSASVIDTVEFDPAYNRYFAAAKLRLPQKCSQVAYFEDERETYAIDTRGDNAGLLELFMPKLRESTNISASQGCEMQRLPRSIADFSITNFNWSGRDVLLTIGGRSLTTKDKKRCHIPVDEVQKYDVVSNVWTQVVGMPTPRSGSSAVYTDGYVYACGGRGDENVVLDAVERFELTASKWEKIAPLQKARFGAGCVSLGGQIYVLGGITTVDAASVTASVERFQTHVGRENQDSRWEAVAPMLTPRAFAAVTECDGKIYVFGGQNEDGLAITDAEVFDPETAEWQPLPPLRNPRMCSSAIVSHTEK